MCVRASVCVTMDWNSSRVSAVVVSNDFYSRLNMLPVVLVIVFSMCDVVN
jgi:hypothetical protein